MNLLLDSQAFVCIELFPERLPDAARLAVEDSGNRLFLSVVSAIELQIKVNSAKIRFARPLAQIFEERISRKWFELLPISLEHVDELSRLPNHHRDPFDRLLIAQAIHDGLTIVTGDEKIREYPVQTLWR